MVLSNVEKGAKEFWGGLGALCNLKQDGQECLSLKADLTEAREQA